MAKDNDKLNWSWRTLVGAISISLTLGATVSNYAINNYRLNQLELKVTEFADIYVPEEALNLTFMLVLEKLENIDDKLERHIQLWMSMEKDREK